MRDDIDLEYFKKRLEQRLKELTEGRKADRPLELDPSRVGRLSRMDAMQAQAMSQATGAKRRELLREVEAALERVEGGLFGECLECGEAISPGRLAANPAARHCINCAEALEANSKPVS